jgi:Family of unknown function (DUF5996)
LDEIFIRACDNRMPDHHDTDSAYPAPEGFAGQALGPSAARWDAALGEYILDWDDVRAERDPAAVALDFARSAFRHACLVCGVGCGPGRQR